MSPSHTNKGGARYRYYVSQAVLQGKPQPAGLLGRVPAAEVEAFVVAALRNHLNASGAGEQLPDNDRRAPRAPSRARDIDFEPSRASAAAERRACPSRQCRQQRPISASDG